MNPEAREQRKCSLAAAGLQSCGKLKLRATGASMLPALWPGDLLTIQYSNFDQVESGDVVLFLRNGRFFVHRVLSKTRSEHELLVTRGDCMPQADPPVHTGELLGKVTKIQRDSWFPAPTLNLSPFRRIFARMLCHCNLLRRIVMRLDAQRRSSRSRFEATVAGPA
jgi:signal peptidase I